MPKTTAKKLKVKKWRDGYIVDGTRLAIARGDDPKYGMSRDWYLVAIPDHDNINCTDGRVPDCTLLKGYSKSGVVFALSRILDEFQNLAD